MQDETSKQQILGADVFTPTTGTGYCDATTIDPGGKGPTLTIYRAKFAAVLVAVQKGNTGFATDSASPSFKLENSYLTQWFYSTICTGNYPRTILI